MSKTEIAVVLGNGESRSHINLDHISSSATLIGCNAIHRDYNVDRLVCCDQRMVYESVNNEQSTIPFIHTRDRYWVDFKKLQKNRRVQKLPDLPYQGTLKPDQPEHWGSGPYAVLLAANLGFKTIYLAGFDLYGNNHLVNNVYKDTPNYLANTKAAVDPAYWIYQIKKVFIHYPDIEFKIFNYEGWRCPEEWIQPNVGVLDIHKLSVELANKINTLYT